MKKLVVLLLAVFLVVPALAYAVKVKLPNGQEISLDGMNQTERNALMDYLAKEPAKVEIPNFKIPNTPTELNEWRQLITGTIKDVATDLNVGVNEFIKTPAGLGVSALIIYKVAGKDMLNRLWSFFIVPYWFIVTSILIGVTIYLFKPTLVYTKKKEITDEKGKTIVRYSEPKRGCRYPFASGEARACAWGFLGSTFVANTIVCIAIFF